MIVASLSILLFILTTVLVYLLCINHTLTREVISLRENYERHEIAAKAILTAEEKERQRIANDLHDGVGQLLSAALINLNGLWNQLQDGKIDLLLAEKSLALVNESYDEMRLISHQMSPAYLLKNGLEKATRYLVEAIDINQLKVNFESFDFDDRLDEQTETVLYRIIQEIISNVLKHSDAKSLNIQMIKDEDGVSIIVEDDGKGFEYDKADERHGIGLQNIFTRTSFLKGAVDIDTSPGKGTLIAIHIFKSQDSLPKIKTPTLPAQP